jgi:hypothetical protein
VLICGDRNWDDEWIIQSIVWGACCTGHEEPCDTIIQGNARGADRMAAAACEGYDDINVDDFLANWAEHGKAAGPIRNQRMLDEGKPDVVVAFHDSLATSKGTADMVRRAVKAGLPVYVVSRPDKATT